VREVRKAAREEADRIAAERRAQAAALAAAQAAAEREAELAARRAREVECAICLENVDRSNAARLPCTHWYCIDDLTRKYSPAYPTGKDLLYDQG
jgi:hypothetical protein